MTRQERAAWIFTAPVLAIIMLVFVLPTTLALALSVTDYSIYALADWSVLRFVGLGNFVDLLSTPLFWRALGNTALFALLGVPAAIGASLGAAWFDYRIVPAIGNSLAVALISTALGLLLTVPAGYAFAKLRFRGRARLLRLLIASLVVPGQVAMLPLFLIMKELGLVNSYAGVILPSLAGIFAILFVRQATLAIPDEMIDAARLDGASEASIFRVIVLPLIAPVTVTLGLFMFLGSWDDFLWPLIVLADQHLYTLPVALAAIAREHAADGELMMAGAVVTTVPVLLIFLALQRYYLRGLLGGSIKG